MSVSVGIPSYIINLIQANLIERSFHDALYPNLLYRKEAMQEEWEAATGEMMIQSRSSLLAPAVKPMTPGQDPTPKSVMMEQWVCRLNRYGDALDTSLITSAVAAANLFVKNIQTLGLQAGQTMNRLPRNMLHKAYNSGHTVLTAAAAAVDTVIQVASLNGFTEMLNPAVNPLPIPISPTNPLPLTINAAAGVITRAAIAFNPTNSLDPYGPGTLTLLTAIGGTGALIRAAVVAADAPKVKRVGGGDSIDAIGAGDVLTMVDCGKAVNDLRKQNVQPHEDGWYHVHFSTDAMSQLLDDPVFQRMYQSLPDHEVQKTGFCGNMFGAKFFMNNESPVASNSGDRTATGTSAFYSEEIAAETTNNTNVAIGRTLVTGKGCLYERWFDEIKHLQSEAGVNGKIGEFDVVNNGLQIEIEGVRLVIRAPQNRLQDIVSAAWSTSTGFAVPSDKGAAGTVSPERFKRAITIEHAV